jgi:hypothetical protein
VRLGSFDEVLSESDFISLHLPCTDETRRIIDRDALRKMRPGSFLINTARGGLVDENALADALADGHIAGAGLDAFDVEPPATSNRLLHFNNVLLSPHRAGVGGGMHALNFGGSSEEYFQRANDEILVVLQTESPRGVENAEAIYSLPGVDAIFVGPVDLRAQMRRPDGAEALDSEFEETLERVIAVGKKTGTPTGIHVMDPEAALQRAAQGMQFIAVGSDLRLMTDGALDVLKQLRPDNRETNLVRY